MSALYIVVAFMVGGMIGIVGGALMAATREESAQAFSWRYECTCGWRGHYLSSAALAPSFLRCNVCKGIAVRRREPDGAAV